MKAVQICPIQILSWQFIVLLIILRPQFLGKTLITPISEQQTYRNTSCFILEHLNWALQTYLHLYFAPDVLHDLPFHLSYTMHPLHLELKCLEIYPTKYFTPVSRRIFFINLTLALVVGQPINFRYCITKFIILNNPNKGRQCYIKIYTLWL